MVAGRLFLLAAVLTSVLAAPPARGFFYEESVWGDLSTTAATPTFLPLDDGANVLTGATDPVDYDIFRFTVGAGQTLDSIILDDFENALGSVSFLGVVTGTTWTAGFDYDVDPAKLLGWVHFGVTLGANKGDDLLIKLSTAPFTPGFTRPLGPGDYTFLIQDTDGPMDYSLTFNASTGGGSGIPGDFDDNLSVDGADLAKWIVDFETGSAGSDADGNGLTDGADLLIWQQNLLVSPGVGMVPEPIGMRLALVGLSAVALRRRGGGFPITVRLA